MALDLFEYYQTKNMFLSNAFLDGTKIKPTSNMVDKK